VRVRGDFPDHSASPEAPAAGEGAHATEQLRLLVCLRVQAVELGGAMRKQRGLWMQGNPPGSAERRWKVCEVADCGKAARLPTPRCKAHGGGMRCVQPGCDKSAVDGYDRCRKDGGGPRCQQEGCPTSARSGYDFCVRHRGGKRCSHPDCTTSACEPHDLCAKHGGNRCAYPDCDRARRGRFCVEHGGKASLGKRCVREGCNHLAQGGDFCGSHGGRRLCLHTGCTKWGRNGSYCVAHNGGKRCESDACAVYEVPPYAGYRSAPSDCAGDVSSPSSPTRPA
jgi:hypothetical protein